MHMQFEILFVSEGHDGTPAAEIQFNGQRLCIIRHSLQRIPQIEFVRDLYVGRATEMIFPLADFQKTVQIAVADLADWLRKLEA